VSQPTRGKSELSISEGSHHDSYDPVAPAPSVWNSESVRKALAAVLRCEETCDLTSDSLLGIRRETKLPSEGARGKDGGTGG
jgi:hypothetical protein